MTLGSLLARLRAIGAKLDADGVLVLPAGVSEADRFFLSNGVKKHGDAVVTAFTRPEPPPEVAAMLAEIERLGGLGAADLLEDVRAGRIPPDGLVKWMRDWHRERFRPTATCQQCGSAIDCLLLARTCRNCIAKET